MARNQASDLGYYRRVKREDPSYTARDAVMEYLDEHPDEAAYIADQYWDDNPDDEMFDQDRIYDLIDQMKPEEAFRLGCMADEGIIGADWVRFDGYANLRIVHDPKEYRKDACRDGMRHILDGDYEISDELQEIIDLFSDRASYNRRPAKKASSDGTTKTKKASKNLAKAPARTGTGKPGPKKTAGRAKKSASRAKKSASGRR